MRAWAKPLTIVSQELLHLADPCAGYARMVYDPDMKILARFGCFFVVLTLLASPAPAEVEKFMQIGDGQLQPFFKLKFTPPDGWVQDAQATKENKLPIYVPKGKNFGNADALMYIRVSFNSDKRSLDKFIEVAHERWNAAMKDSKITKLANEKRTNAKPDFQIYHFVNPSKPQQAYEMMAYGEDTDKDGNNFFLMIALTGAKQKALDAAEADYRAGLRAH
jgi:hypothetical protein